MKKSLSLVLAVIFALAAIFAVSTMVFAGGADAGADSSADTPAADAPKADTPAADAPKETEKVVTRPANDRDATEKSTEASKSNDTSSASVNGLSQLESLVSKLDSSTNTTIPNSAKDDDAPVVTNPAGQTAFVNDDTSAAAANTTKAPAVVSTYVPKTGSTAAVPAIAILALLAGTAAVVAVKKNDD